MWCNVYVKTGVPSSCFQNYCCCSIAVPFYYLMRFDDICLLTYWGRVTHICVSRLNIISSDNGLSPGRRQAIIWTNAGILLIGPLGTNFSENAIEILTFSLTKMRLNVSSAKRRPFLLGLNVLKVRYGRAFMWLLRSGDIYEMSHPQGLPSSGYLTLSPPSLNDGAAGLQYGMYLMTSRIKARKAPVMMTSSNGNIFSVSGICAGNSLVTGEFPAQRPVTQGFDAFFDLRLYKRVSKQWLGWWSETPSSPL